MGCPPAKVERMQGQAFFEGGGGRGRFPRVCGSSTPVRDQKKPKETKKKKMDDHTKSPRPSSKAWGLKKPKERKKK